MALGLLVALRLGAAEPATVARRPNILVIMSDEHNARVMGCAGDPVVRTPNLDALAARGIRFDAHYCSSPICTPARQSFTTGRYVAQHNVWTNSVGVPESWPTLPKLMRESGYDPYLIGKMHYRAGRTYGFTTLGKVSGGGKGSDDAEKGATKERHRLQPGVFPDRGAQLGEEFSPLGETDQLDAFIDVDRRNLASKFLSERAADAKPFFLVVGFISPHYPLVAPPADLARYKDKVPAPEVPPGYIDTLPMNYRHLRNVRLFERVPDEISKLARESYYARVEWTDRQIGGVLDALRASPFADNTVVIYTSDHGENLGEHGLWWKNCMYDSGARVPLIMSWPARWPGGQARAGACQVVDLVQTIADLGAVKPSPEWSGNSMVPWLDRSSFPWKDRAVCEFYAGYIASGITMIREKGWKYVYHARANEQFGPERELYDMAADPKELRNLAKDPAQQPRLAAMHAALVKELGEDPETTEARWRAGATPERPQGNRGGSK